MDVTMSTSAQLPELIRSHRQGESLPGPFYLSDEIFKLEIQRFLGSHWMLVGHASQLPSTGDYLVVDTLGASVIVVRDSSGGINAFHNVCRHRGARICEASNGRTSLFRCRYHGWSYKLTGELAAWRHMPEGLEKRDYPLRRCGVTSFQGFILICLEPKEAPDPPQLLEHVEPYWSRYELSKCKVVAERTYRMRANWKLCVENNLECYHCLSGHPEYTAVNAFVRADECVSQSVIDSFSAFREGWEARMRSAGTLFGRSEMRTVQSQMCRAGTVPLAPGKVTASRDGQGLAPLLGRIAAYDESVTTGGIGFLSYVMATCDYALSVTYLPEDAGTTNAIMRWLVREDAVAGRDYDLGELCFLWDETTKQDKELIELNAAGVRSRGYSPGPYSRLESLTADFIDRYLALMSGAS
jgi:phenylpropionate dioxygenase-like ring-hydroxylating dioxygenase large terminal subunit